MGIQLHAQKGGADFLDTIISAQGGQESSPDELCTALEKLESDQASTTSELSESPSDPVDSLINRFRRTGLWKWCRKGPRALWRILTDERFRERLNIRRAIFSTLTFGLMSMPGTSHVSRANNAPNPETPHQNVEGRLLESSASGRYRIISLEDDDREGKNPDPSSSPEPVSSVSHHVGPQILMVVNSASHIPSDVMAMASNGSGSNVQVFTPPTPPQSTSSTTSTNTTVHTEARIIPRPESDEEDTDELEGDPEPEEAETPAENSRIVLGLHGTHIPSLLLPGETEFEETRDSIRASDIKLSLNTLGSQSSDYSDYWEFDRPPETSDRIPDFHPDFEVEIPPFPRDYLDQLTFDEGPGRLPLEIAYEMAMRIATRTIMRSRRLWRDIRRSQEEQSERPREPHPETHRAQIRNSLGDIIAGSSFRVQIGLRKFSVRGGVEFNLPWDDGTLELEGIFRGRFRDQPLDRLTFKATLEQQILGGELEVQGRVDYRPTGYDPLTYQLRVNFQAPLFGGAAHLGTGLRYRTGSQGNEDLSFTFGLVIHLEKPPRQSEDPGPQTEEERIRAKLERRLGPYRSSQRLIRAGRSRYEDQVPEDVDSVRMPLN